MFDWLRRRGDPSPEVAEAIEKRDALFADAKDAMEEVDRVQQGIIADFEQAEQDRINATRQ